MSFGELNARAYALEAAAGFTRTLLRYMDETASETPGEALAALAARDGNGSRPTFGH